MRVVDDDDPGSSKKGWVSGRRVVHFLSDERLDGESVLAVASPVT
jgi:hypothetical protein